MTITNKNVFNMKLWLSAHIFYFGDLNQLLLKCVAPLVDILKDKKIISKYFFIRYWEGGPHIRLRLYGEDINLHKEGKNLVEDYVQDFFFHHPAASNINKEYMEALLKKYSLLERGTDETVDIRMENSLEYIDYVPELARYGGDGGVKIAEDNFHLSSINSMVLLSLLEQKRINRIAMAFKLMIITLALFNIKIETMRNFTQRYCCYWKKYISEDEQKISSIFDAKYHNHKNLLCNTTKQVLALNKEQFLRHADPILCSWSKTVLKLAHDLNNEVRQNGILMLEADNISSMEDYILFFLASVLHMNNNRLGINPAEESYLGYLINRTLMDI